MHDDTIHTNYLIDRVEFLQNILDTAMSAIVVLTSVRDTEGKIEDLRFQYFNRRAEELTGLHSEELSGELLLPRFPGNRESGLFDQYAHVIETGEPMEVETRYDYEGFNGWVRISARKFGEAIVLTFDDTTRARENAESLVASNNRFDSIVENTALGLLVCERSGLIRFVNRPLCAMFGYEADELDGKSLGSLIAEECRSEIAKYWPDEKSLPSTASHIDIRGVRKCGADIPIEFALTPVDWDATTQCYLATISDITARRDMEQEQVELARAFQEAQKAESLGVLAGGIAHDFNNILSAIIGNTELLMLEGDDADRRLDKLREIEKSARRASDLCNEMLAYSGRGKFVIEPINLSNLTREMVNMLEVTVSKRAELKLELDSSVPAVEADATQIRQVIMNLVINACEAIRDSSGEVVIRTGTSEFADSRFGPGSLDAGTYVTLTVSDTGVGISADRIEKIFDPFFTSKSAGTGLGLSAVLGIANSHRGAVWVDSTPGEGSTFTLALPATIAEARLETPVRRAGMGLRGTGHVLVADDEETVLSLACNVLERAGYTVTSARDGDEAVAKALGNGGVDLALLDLTMPGLSGLQALAKLRQQFPDLPVVIMSGYTDDDVSPLLANGTLSGFVQKPFTSEELCSAVHIALVQ